MASDLIGIEVTGSEATLILRYGYPFPDIEPIFEAIAGRRGYHQIEVDRYWLEMLAGDLARSMRETGSGALVDKLDAIYTTIEIAVGGFR